MAEEKHMLQTLCERAAAAISQSIQHQCPVTLICFYKQVLADGNAFASSLPDQEAVTITVEAVVSRLCGAPLPLGSPLAWLPFDEDLPTHAEKARTMLPFSCGFVLVFGSGVDSSHVSFEEPEHVLSYLSHIVLPTLTGGASPA